MDAAPAETRSRVVETMIPVVVPVAASGAPVVNVPMPSVRVIAVAVVAAPPVTTVMVPKPGVDPTAAVLTTATFPTVTPAHAVAHVRVEVPAAAAAPLSMK